MSLGKLGVPIGKTRLAGAVCIAVPVAVFMYLAVTNMQWLTPMRMGYVVLGVSIGLLLALLETKTVLSKLSKNSEIIVWQVEAAGLVLFGVPLLLVWALGGREYVPFGLFAFFPFMITQLAASGYLFDKYDRENNVLVYGFVYGFKYWVGPSSNVDDYVGYFLSAVASKDTASLWSCIGYSHGIYRKLQHKQIGDSQTQQALLKLLSTMKKYRVIALTHFVATLILTPVLFAVLFSSFDSTVFGVEMPNIIMPALMALWVSLGINVYASMHLVKKSGAQIMATIDSASLPHT
ncbi:MAG: hypothetical protein NWE93_02935 [Candidatus Bathyarchaeota archaeon]|nr:hypothetical protein [Candidatus Bathyarchaeota archaeon]